MMPKKIKRGGAEKLFLEGTKLVDIAEKLGIPEGTVRRCKSPYKLGDERSESAREDRN